MNSAGKKSSWWRNATVYQIYPRSFQDSNGDGIGDIRGIIQRLDYIQDLGVDALWLSPIFDSPMYDFGYDIRDYRAIDPTFGTFADFEKLLIECTKRGLRVLLDGVFNHTSHLHPWFIESRSSKDNPKRDWYIWRKERNNWLSIFGGRAWEHDARTDEYYLHSFLKEQPDLNWRNPEVKAAVFSEIEFWLELGVSGFRFDVINFFFKDEHFRDNPFGFGPTPRPYDLQRHLYDRNRPELHGLLQELRALLDRFGAMMVGEIFSETRDAELSASYLGAGDELHLAFDFSLMYADWDARDFQRQLSAYHNAVHPDAWPCSVFSNHDQPRSASRFGGRDASARAKVLAVLLMTIRGTPFLYYGEEIGMRDRKLRRREIVDPLGKKYWPFHKGRDPARTPMQWSGDAFAGFSSTKPWLPVHPKHPQRNVAQQLDDPESVLNVYRAVIALRKQHTSLREGDLDFRDPKATPDDMLVYDRGELTVSLNFAGSERELSLPSSSTVLYSTHRGADEALPARFTVQPYEATVLRRAGG